jgi:hypothetical protein
MYIKMLEGKTSLAKPRHGRDEKSEVHLKEIG